MTSRPNRLAVLGATGSIGANALKVASLHPERFQIYALTAYSNVRVLHELVQRYQPAVAVVVDPSAAESLRRALSGSAVRTEILEGGEALVELVRDPEVDTVVAGVVGAAGIASSYAAAAAGKRLLLANKESMVCAGRLLRAAIAKAGGVLLPVDSEHNALFQCLQTGIDHTDLRGVRKLILTGSGGPFLRFDTAALSAVTPEQACRHPRWQMGRKISVDSATWMNKGLEYIEACRLFDIGPERLEVVIHPQSVVHSMVEYVDGSVLAQLGYPDMRTPLAHALGWPERIESGTDEIHYPDFSGLTFEPPDLERFPCLQYAIDAVRAEGLAPIALNAANEVAVDAFLAGRIGFADISRTVAGVLDKMGGGSEPDNVEVVLAADAEARCLANAIVEIRSN